MERKYSNTTGPMSRIPWYSATAIKSSFLNPKSRAPLVLAAIAFVVFIALCVWASTSWENKWDVWGGAFFGALSVLAAGAIAVFLHRRYQRSRGGALAGRDALAAAKVTPTVAVVPSPARL